jgi:hypothetical protein
MPRRMNLMTEILINAPPIRSLSPQQKRVKELLEMGKTDPQVCKILHIPFEELHELMSGIYEKGQTIMTPSIPQEKRDKAAELYAAGMMQKDIAMHLNISRTAVCNICKTLPKPVIAKEDKPMITAPDFSELITPDKKEAPASVAPETNANALNAEPDVCPAVPIIPDKSENVKGVTAIPDAVRQMLREKAEEMEREALKFAGDALILQQQSQELMDKVKAARNFLVQNGGLDDERT